MWYDNVISQFEHGRVYSRSEIFDELLKEKTALTYNSFKWILSDLMSKKVIDRLQRDQYVLRRNFGTSKSVYQPSLNTDLMYISKRIEEKFPFVEYVCFESIQLNEFLNHLIGKNTVFVMVEKESVDYVFRYLQDEMDRIILLKPTEKEWDAYHTSDCVVLLNLVSEAPKGVGEYHAMCIEQMLVDIIAEKTFRYLYSESELSNIFERAEENYLIDYVRMMRYARRRGKAEEIRKYIRGGYADKR